MATRETIPVQSEPYTKGYYTFWALLSVVSIAYIGFLAFGSDQASIIKISKVEENSGLVIKFRQQSKRVSTALSIASRAKEQTTINSKRLNSIEKRVQLITWKLAGGDRANERTMEVSQQAPADDHTLAYEAIKQVIGGDDINEGGIIGSVIQSPSKALNAARTAAGKVAAATAKVANSRTVISPPTDTISAIAGVIDTKPLSGFDLITNPTTVWTRSTH